MEGAKHLDREVYKLLGVPELNHHTVSTFPTLILHISFPIHFILAVSCSALSFSCSCFPPTDSACDFPTLRLPV